MTQNRLGDVQPEALTQYLPAVPPVGTAEWKFVHKTGQVIFVQVEGFFFGDEYLAESLVLGVATDPAIHMEAHREVKGVFTIEDADERSICEAFLERHADHTWEASFMMAGRTIGKAKGSVGTQTPEQFIEAALTALVRCATA
jgi:hypothetical protein